MDLGKILAQLRKKNGQSQRDFANTFGVSNGAVAMWETNKRQPDLETLKKISAYYNVSIDYLLSNDTNHFPATHAYNSLSWNTVTKKYPDAIRTNQEEKDLLSYYKQLSLNDKRWIMGQMIDLIKREEQKSAVPKAQ